MTDALPAAQGERWARRLGASGFSLVEVMVVILFVSLLAMIEQ